MKKQLFIMVVLLLLAVPMNVFATEQEMIFNEVGGGKFIYCNNPEAINRKDLADVGNPDPTLLMQNDDLKPGKHNMYIFHINNTSVRNEENIAIEPGFDIELDVRFWTKTGAKIKITKLSYEVPIKERVDDITFIDAWASYLQFPIKDVVSNYEYIPIKFEPVEITLDAGSADWLGNYIENYAPIPFRKSVKLIADFEVLEGTVNADIVALRSHNSIRDRSNYSANAKRGILNDENQYKGIANTLPVVTADLNFTFDANTPVEKPIPVKIFNQYLHYGKVVDEWMTNINPQADEHAKFNAVESDMLKFEFYDGMKKSYYDKNVPEEQKDDIWKFDVFHNDVMFGKPNQPLSISNSDKSITCNLANYGVRTQYHITATNNANAGKSFEYYVSTKSSNIVYSYEPSATNRAAAYKDKTDSTDKILMFSKWLEPGTTQEFFIENILPTDVAGGIQNSFLLSNEKKDNYIVKEVAFKNPEIFETNKYKNYPMGEFAKKLFNSNINNYDIVPVGDKYFVRWNAYDGIKGAINKYIVAFYSKIYIFDENFELLDTKNLEGLPKENVLNGIIVQIENKLVDFDQVPVIEDGRILVPARAVFEAVGASVDWDEISQTATITHLDKTIKVQVDNKQANVNGKIVYTDVSAKQINSRILVPLRFLAEELGHTVNWESNIGWVTLKPTA